MNNTKIEWCDATWNVSVGCSAVSEGCKNCYAKRMHKRLQAMGGDKYSEPFDVVKLDQKSLYIPRKWKTPKRIFVNSMSDLFHEKLDHHDRAAIFLAMSRDPQHNYLVLTKRPEVALEFHKFTLENYQEALKHEAGQAMIKVTGLVNTFKTILDVFERIHLGVSVENQATADERIPLLLQIPAAVRFVSAEPLLGPVDLNRRVCERCLKPYPKENECPECVNPGTNFKFFTKSNIWLCNLDWIIVGGETGPGARPMHPDWVRNIRDQCQAAKVPFFFKGWGEYVPINSVDSVNLEHDIYGYWENDGSYISQVARADGVVKVGRSKAGDKLDGQEWKEYPMEHPAERIMSDDRGMMNEEKADD